MHVFNKVGVGAVAVAAAVISVALAVPARADNVARAGDVVGVGSNTAQNAADFVFDGAPGVAGGYNTNGNFNRAVDVSATGDANGRAAYDGTCGLANLATGIGSFCDSTSNLAPYLGRGSVVLRAGTAPVVRPNGSSAGVGALIADSAAPGYEGLPTGSIQFARMSRLPNSTEEGNCPTTTASCAGLHVFQIATDNLTIARTSAGYKGPAGLSATELVSIYTCNTTRWNQIPGNSSGSTDTIHPLIPALGSGARDSFLAYLQVFGNGGTAVTPGLCVRAVEEHDPTGIYADPTPGDAIEPFSTGKLALINSGYFTNGAGYSGTSFANGAYTPNYLTTLTGTAPDGTASYLSTSGLYFTIRQADVIGTTPFQPGSTQTWVSALINGAASAVRSAAGKAEIQAAGFTAAYKDCGINPTSC